MAYYKSKAVNTEKLYANVGITNLAEDLKEEKRTEIARRVMDGYGRDLDSCKEWRENVKEGMTAAGQVVTPKTFPWPGAANIKYPMIATACIQFASRAFPQLINNVGGIVKAEINGQDEDGKKAESAKRVGQHMSWQLTKQMTEWESDMDKLLHCISVAGTWFKKTYFCPIKGRNVSYSISPLELIINNKHKGDLTTCRRISHEIWMYRNDAKERELAEIYLKDICEQFTTDDEDNQELFIEQHMWYDLDEDGYDEPYIAVVHEPTGKLARLVANYTIEGVVLDSEDKFKRIDPNEYFTKYTFIPSLSGDFYDIGFAHLLRPINEAVSTLINQLLDGGTLANTGGGFISRGIRGVGGNLTFSLGEWKPVDVIGGTLRDGIVPLPVRDPSNVLFQLLGMLDAAGQKLASVTDLMAGETPSQNTPATTVLALIEQGLKVFTAIHKRLYKSMSQEFKKLYDLNCDNVDEDVYFRFNDENKKEGDSKVVYQEDYNKDSFDIVPTADPTVSSQAQELAQAQALLQTLQMNPNPRAQMEILAQYYKAIGAKNIDKLVDMEAFEESQKQPPPPDPAILELKLKTQMAKDKHMLELETMRNTNMKLAMDLEKIAAEIEVLKSQVIMNIATAESKEVGDQLDTYSRTADMIHKTADLKIKAAQAQVKAEAAPAEVDPAEVDPAELPAQEAPVTPEPPIPPTVNEPALPPEEGEGLGAVEDIEAGNTPTLMEGGTAPPRPDALMLEEGA